jgi:hypothetical protein
MERLAKNKMLEVQNEILAIRNIAKKENVSMSFVLNVKKYLEQKKSNDLFVKANVIVNNCPSALEKIAMQLDKNN